MRVGNINQPTEPLGAPTCTVSILSKLMGWANPNNKTTSNVSIRHKLIRGFPVSIPVLPSPSRRSVYGWTFFDWDILRPFCLSVSSQTLQDSKTRTYNILPDMYMYNIYYYLLLLLMLLLGLSLIICIHIVFPYLSTDFAAFRASKTTSQMDWLRHNGVVRWLPVRWSMGPGGTSGPFRGFATLKPNVAHFEWESEESCMFLCFV